MLTEEQREARRGKITSSLVAGCLGLNPYQTRIAAALEARGTNDDHEEPQNAKALQRGNKLEDVVLGHVADEMGWTWSRPEFRLHPHHAWAGDSCDAVYHTQDGDLVAIGEGKTAALGSAQGFGEEGTDEVPTACLLQAQWHLAHWPEVDVCWVPVLVGGFTFEFRLYRVGRERELQAVLFEDLAQFWEKYVHGNELPEPEAGDTEFLVKRFPVASSRLMADSPRLRNLARAIHAARSERKAVAEREDKLKNELRLELGEAQGVRAAWGNVHYKNSKERAKTNWEQIARELAGGDVPPELIHRHTSIVPGARRLLVAPRKGVWDDISSAV
jgi:predicted phage-related endonuclease